MPRVSSNASSSHSSSSKSHSDMPTAYTVEMFADGSHLFSSTCYNSREEVEDLIKYMRDMDPSKMTFQVYKSSPRSRPEVNEWHLNSNESTLHELFNSDNEEDVDETVCLTGMTLESYGKGYLLRPYKDCTFVGEKYLLDGWWMPSQDAWFFKASFYDTLIELGAEYVTDEPVDVDDSSNEYSSFDGLIMEDYGKGLMVYPNKSHRYYARKYMGSGFWNQRAKGWFFKNDMFDTLMGAQVVYNS